MKVGTGYRGRRVGVAMRCSPFALLSGFSYNPLTLAVTAISNASIPDQEPRSADLFCRSAVLPHHREKPRTAKTGPRYLAAYPLPKKASGVGSEELLRVLLVTESENHFI